ncbi:YhcH/YjgK/YiaL family protein [Anaerotalea alkaliphila]|uniref:DUF386 domain-containing protein n=1 Tax=Anaerotalea alkaliphila TaxID=2662126 RepID=A0A7X5HU82_9FIRM|nr:YhcH/YjgK/YiaL family protein [Anaerotalea alkaliphila]NDL66655.1 DUF386 domain-containing protein [Anaerotalea alkaliphila]
MIIDDVKNIAYYDRLLPGLKACYETVSKMLPGLEEGRYEFEGGFFMIQQGMTKPMEEGDFETHDRHVDVQIMLDGSETLAWAEREGLEEVIGYNAQKDATYYAGAADHSIQIDAGMFYVAFPHDGHKAVRHSAKPTKYRKIVLKLPADL